MSLKQVSLLLLLMLPLSVLGNELYLEGLSVIGKQKTAHVVLDNQSLSVIEGDSVKACVVTRIATRSVFLRCPESEKLLELPLQARVSLEAPSPKSEIADRIAKAVAEGQTVIAPPQPEKIEEGVYRAVPYVIEDEDIPPGYYRKQTLFGDYLIKEGTE
ncbi:MAG: hypothetical protein VSS75_011870 [Candidatus Parabeggiatoa sp.]|nr:hypothetical protein [Candidatus Parabeggiatoa sp.]